MLGSAGPPAEPAELQSASSVLHFIGAAGLGRPDDTSRTLRELFHQALLEKAPDVVFTLSPEGVITSLNPAFDRITGWPAVEWIGRTFLALVHPDDHPVVTTLLRRAGRGDDLPMFELRLRTSSGTHINAQFTTTPLFDGEEPGGLLGMARDVTEQKRIEDALRQRGSILEAVAFAAQRLAGARSWRRRWWRSRPCRAAVAGRAPPTRGAGP